ncbi:unnamed protein product [Gongylonema pulchrum]|nr:unnamed protein product [Gongylonema pulchrum]
MFYSGGIFNGFQSYAQLAPTSPPGGVTNGVAPVAAAAAAAGAGGVTRGFNVAAVQAAAAQQAVAFEAAALYAIGGEPFAGVYPSAMQQPHQTTQLPHAFHKV